MNTDPTMWSVGAKTPTSETANSIRLFTPSSMELPATDGMGDAGPLHAVVIEYVMSAPGSPVRTYFEAWLAEGGDRDASPEVTHLRDRAIGLAGPGGSPTATEYARAWSRLVTEPISRLLAESGVASIEGVVEVTCCVTVDPVGLRLVRRRDTRAQLGMLVVRNQAARFVMVQWRDSLRSGTLAWDVSALPAAFDPEAALDYATVAAALVPLHVEVAP